MCGPFLAFSRSIGNHWIDTVDLSALPEVKWQLRHWHTGNVGCLPPPNDSGESRDEKFRLSLLDSVAVHCTYMVKELALPFQMIPREEMATTPSSPKTGDSSALARATRQVLVIQLNFIFSLMPFPDRPQHNSGHLIGEEKNKKPKYGKDEGGIGGVDAEDPKTRIFTDNQELNSGILGFGLGIGGALLAGALLDNARKNQQDPCQVHYRDGREKEARFYLRRSRQV